ncbi:hypothetical protein [Rhodococcus kronopolitis]|uniref:Uncharacterized protein n=1 Tax=Rhodococcus kronopolitis TaxID=1460226 RepID=A0ABV9FQQ1_9NOCA
MTDEPDLAPADARVQALAARPGVEAAALASGQTLTAAAAEVSAAPTLPDGDIGAATAGVSAVLLAAGATGFASFRGARATRTRLNLARAEFLDPR